MTLFRKLFQDTKPVIGMVHLLPLPGAPGYRGSMEEIYEAAHNDLKNLIEGGADAVIVENFGDIPYAKENELITNTAFASVASQLRRECTLPMGINVQFDNVEAEWAIAYSCDYDFIRSEVFAENRMGPNGVFTASGPQIMRLKARYPKDIALLADVNVKHTFPVTEQPLDFTIESIIEGGADCLICTGVMTGKSPGIEDVQLMKKIAGDFPVIVGSGVNDRTAKDYFEVSDGAIIGSYFKEDGNVMRPIDPKRVRKLVQNIR